MGKSCSHDSRPRGPLRNIGHCRYVHEILHRSQSHTQLFAHHRDRYAYSIGTVRVTRRAEPGGPVSEEPLPHKNASYLSRSAHSAFNKCTKIPFVQKEKEIINKHRL